MPTPRALSPVPVRASNPRTKYPLDKKLIRISRKADYLRVRDFVRNIALVASSGSGKTTILDLLESSCWVPNAGHGALVHCPKEDSAERAYQIACMAGRRYDTKIVSPTSGHSFEPISYALKNAGAMASIDEAFDELWTAVEILNRDDVLRQGDAFFEPAQKQMTRNGMAILHAAYPEVKLEDLLGIIQQLPRSYEALGWPERYPVLGHLAEARKKWKRGANHGLDIAEDYFTKTVPGLSDKTLSSIAISAETKVSPVWDEPIYTMCFSKPMNISPDFILNGGIVILDVPVSRWRGAARAVATMWMQALQKRCLQREVDEYTVPIGIWADDGGAFMTDYLVEACERGRSAKLYHVIAYQGNSTLETGYGGGESGKGKSKSLKLNCNIRIMGGQTDPETRLDNADTCGKEEVLVTTEGQQENQSTAGGRGSTGKSVSLTPHERHELPERAFLGLKDGSDGIVEAFVFRIGPPFKANGKRFLRVRFRRGRPRPNIYLWFERKFECRNWGTHVEFVKVFIAFFLDRQNFNLLFYRWSEHWLDARMAFGRWLKGML
jgi:hypothetical protein